jgi:hypothetical protein
MDGPRARLLSSTWTTDNVRNAAGAVPTKNNYYQPGLVTIPRVEIHPRSMVSARRKVLTFGLAN